MDSPLIKLTNLFFKYNNSEDFALSDINLEIRKGEFICVTGSSGGGKTTLALALCGFIPHIIEGNFEGNVSFQGYDTDKLTIAEISQLIGLVQQDPENQLVTSTPIEEIAFGPENLCLSKEEIFERVTRSVSFFDLDSLAFRLINEMSGGEKQKVAIASILAMRPKVLVLDEPTAFLDKKSTNELLEVLKDLNQNEGITIIIIDHQPSEFKKYINRMIIVEKSRIKADLDNKSIDYDSFIIPRDNLIDIQSIKAKTSLKSLIRIRDLNIVLNNRKILKNITLNIKPGLIYGLIGLNGSGKTTLLQSILNLIPIQKNIFYNDQTISEIPTYKLANDFGLVFQNPNHQIFEKTLMKEILFAPRNFKQNLNDASMKAEILLSEVKLEQYSNRTPFNLSYGEKRRLNICSIEIYEPKLLLLDEPFIGQDSKNVTFLLNLLKKRKMDGKTTIIVSHRPELYDIVDLFLVLDNGKLLFEGNPTEVISFFQQEDRGFFI